MVVVVGQNGWQHHPSFRTLNLNTPSACYLSQTVNYVAVCISMLTLLTFLKFFGNWKNRFKRLESPKI